MGRVPYGLSRQLDSTKWPAGRGANQYEWEAPRTVLQKDSERNSRIKALGNAVVPQVVQPIAEAIHAVLKEADSSTSAA
jgi:hypothetical protein